VTITRHGRPAAVLISAEVAAGRVVDSDALKPRYGIA
jgi:antitoxin (DNA-binding transcriptional repressor) of toxin-antitoxin stability system